MFKKKLDIYNVAIEDNNVTYSIDKIRLKTFITYSMYNDLDFYIRTYFGDLISKYYISNRIMQFRYNWNIEIEEGRSFFIGFNHNTEDKLNERFEPKYNLTVEFNPNKVKDDRLLKHILGLSGLWYIVRYDLAMDIPVSIRDLILDKSGRRKFHFFGTSAEDKTYECGQMGDRHFKIYNKKLEAKLNIMGELTRIEVTRCLEDFPICNIAFFNYDNYFPEVYLNQYIYSLSDVEKKKEDRTLYALLYAVQNGYSINDLSRVYREKIKKLLLGGYKIKFSDKIANLALKKTILHYFLKNSLVAFK